MMKHIILKILPLLVFTLLNSQEMIINKQISFGVHHSTFEILSDSLYYIVSNVANKNYTKKKGVIAIINKEGEVKNLIKLGSNNNYILSSTKLQDNSFLFVGYNKENNDEWNRIYVIKTDQNFNMIWENSYGPLNSDSKGYSIIEANENEYWILGHTKTSKNGVLLLKIDKEGTEKWFSYLPNLDCNFANNMIVDSKKNIIISGHKSNQLFIS